MPSYFFSAYGLRIASNLPLPGLLCSDGPDAPELVVSLGSALPEPARSVGASVLPWYKSPERAESSQSALQVWKLDAGAYYFFRYADATEFVVDSRGTSVWAVWPQSTTLEDTATYLLGPILGFVLRLRGITCLHASGVVTDGGALALAGPPGAGKSTTAAALASQGLAVLSDDVLPLEAREEALWVRPGYPRLNLWPDSAGFLYGSPDRLPLIAAGWPKRFLDVTQAPFAFHSQSARLGAIYLLEAGAGTGLPCVEPGNNRSGLLSLVAQTYVNYLLDPPMRACEFKLLGRLVAGVPVRRVQFAATPASFALLSGVILKDLEQLPSPHS